MGCSLQRDFIRRIIFLVFLPLYFLCGKFNLLEFFHNRFNLMKRGVDFEWLCEVDFEMCVNI